MSLNWWGNGLRGIWCHPTPLTPTPLLSFHFDLFNSVSPDKQTYFTLLHHNHFCCLKKKSKVCSMKPGVCYNIPWTSKKIHNIKNFQFKQFFSYYSRKPSVQKHRSSTVQYCTVGFLTKSLVPEHVSSTYHPFQFSPMTKIPLWSCNKYFPHKFPIDHQDVCKSIVEIQTAH